MVIDQFLPTGLASALVNFVLDPDCTFRPTTVQRPDRPHVNEQKRKSLHCVPGLGFHKAPFLAAVHADLSKIFTELGVPPFPVADTEVQLVAHRDGDFFNLHIDTFVQDGRISSDRVISGVYYFHREPRKFAGGELLLYAVGGQAAPHIIEPKHNRFVAFPSFTPHEVRPIHVATGEFSDSRFSINCWLHRARR